DRRCDRQRGQRNKQPAPPEPPWSLRARPVAGAWKRYAHSHGMKPPSDSLAASAWVSMRSSIELAYQELFQTLLRRDGETMWIDQWGGASGWGAGRRCQRTSA